MKSEDIYDLQLDEQGTVTDDGTTVTLSFCVEFPLKWAAGKWLDTALGEVQALATDQPELRPDYIGESIEVRRYLASGKVRIRSILRLVSAPEGRAEAARRLAIVPAMLAQGKAFVETVGSPAYGIDA